MKCDSIGETLVSEELSSGRNRFSPKVWSSMYKLLRTIMVIVNILTINVSELKNHKMIEKVIKKTMATY